MKILTLILAAATLCVTYISSAQEIIAHRGYHTAEGATQNSITAMRAAQEADIYASECDVNITKDGILVVAHGPLHSHNERSVRIDESTFSELRAMPLRNGELMPTLEEYLAQAATDTSTRLIIELKPQQHELEGVMTDATIAMVARYNLTDSVTYISFSRNICDILAQRLPAAEILYLNGDISPDEAKQLGYSGINYHIGRYKEMEGWIERAHELGLVVGTWTINNAADAEWALEHNIDLITTDNPPMIADIISDRAK